MIPGSLGCTGYAVSFVTGPGGLDCQVSVTQDHGGIWLDPDSLGSIDIKSQFIGTLRGVDLRQHPRPI